METHSFAKSPTSFDRLSNPLQGGCKAPSATGCTPFISKDSNFRRVHGQPTRNRVASLHVRMLIEQARQDKNLFKTRVKKTRKNSKKVIADNFYDISELSW